MSSSTTAPSHTASPSSSNEARQIKNHDRSRPSSSLNAPELGVAAAAHRLSSTAETRPHPLPPVTSSTARARGSSSGFLLASPSDAILAYKRLSSAGSSSTDKGKHRHAELNSSPANEHHTPSSPHMNDDGEGAASDKADSASSMASTAAPSGGELQSGASTLRNSFNLDPSRIVDLALNLSKSRRRNYGRIRPVSQPFASIREDSSRVAVPGPIRGFSGELPSDKRQSHLSALPGTRPSSTLERNDNRHSTSLAFEAVTTSRDSPTADNVVFENEAISEATLLRAEKARATLELAYQYRRLLQYLPSLSNGGPSRPGTAKDRSRRGLAPAESGRVYNPLQFIRNRKIRSRLDQRLNADSEGWSDTPHVRDWVDVVVNEKTGEHADPKQSLNDHRLPSFSKPLLPIEDPVFPGTRKARPRTEWIFSPSDLLADAYWLAQGDNRYLIENRQGRKVMGTPPSLVPPSPRLKKTFSHVRNSSSISRSQHPGEAAARSPRETSRQPRTPGIQSSEPVASRRSSLSSPERASKWSRRFTRSASLSNSDASEDAPSAAQEGQSRLPSRERKDSLIMDNQMNQLLAQKDDLQAANLEKAEQPQSSGSMLSDDGQYEPYQDRSLPLRHSFRQASVASVDSNYIRPLAVRSPTASSEMRQTVSSPTTPELGSNIPRIAVDSSARSSPRLRQRFDEIQAEVGDLRLSLGHNYRSDLPSESSSPELTRNRDGHHNGRGFAHKRRSDASELGVLSPKATARASMQNSRGVSKSSRAEQDMRDFESKLKGLSKAGKLVGLVSSPVSKVGGLLWRKDDSEDPRLWSPTSSYVSEASDTEHGGASRAASRRPEPNSASSNGEAKAPVYRPRDLPVFKSSGRSGQGDKPTAANVGLGVSSGSPDPKRPNRFRRHGMHRLQTDLSAESGSEDLRPRSAGLSGDALLAPQALPSEVSHQPISRNPSPTQRPEHETGRSPKVRPAVDRRRVSWSELQCVKTRPSKREMIGLTALWTSNQGMMRNLTTQLQPQRHAGKHKSYQPNWTRGFAAAQKHIHSTESSQKKLRQAAEHTLSKSVEDLHVRARAVDSYVTSDLTGGARSLADEADQLGLALSTGYTLEIKRLHDRIDNLLRQRRRRLRWMRRIGYALLEWTLLGTMWLVWLIVTLLRMGRATFRATHQVIRWLLWL